MADNNNPYTPTPVQQGYGQEAAINQNFVEIAAALATYLSRLTATDNSIAVDLDMAGKLILNLISPVNPTDPVRLQDLNSLSVTEVVQTLTYSAAISIDIEALTYGILTLAGNTTITFTGGEVEGQVILLRLVQDVTGSRIVTWDAKVRFSDDLPEPVLSTAGGKTDYLVFRRNVVDDTYDFMAINRGFV